MNYNNINYEIKLRETINYDILVAEQAKLYKDCKKLSVTCAIMMLESLVKVSPKLAADVLENALTNT